MGVLGLSPATLQDMTLAEVRLAIIARFTYDNLQHRQSWEQARLVSYFSLAPHAKKGALKKPNELFLLPWEERLAPKSKKIEDIPEGWKKFIRRHDQKDGIITPGAY